MDRFVKDVEKIMFFNWYELFSVLRIPLIFTIGLCTFL